MPRTRLSIYEALCHFEELKDPRWEINGKHPLASVVVIAIVGVLAQATGPTGIATWAKFHAEFLQSLLPLPHGVARQGCVPARAVGAAARCVSTMFRQLDFRGRRPSARD